MKCLDKTDDIGIPISWVNTEYLPDSKGIKKEIYLIDDNELEGMILLFHTLFSDIKDNIKIYDSSWWDFTLDTWNIHTDEYDYTTEGKHPESKAYYEMLGESSLEVGYSGSCTCTDFDRFLHITLQCIVHHIAPYGHHFYNSEFGIVFYFHHTGSMGLYYKEENEVVKKILSIAKDKYDVRDVDYS